MPLALVAAAAGLGDIVRATPLVRVFAGLGYEVDLLLAPDYAGTTALFEGAAEVRRVVSAGRRAGPAPPVPALEGVRYDVAAFTHWAAPLRARVNAARAFAFPRRAWLEDGDSACVERIAREAGWTGAIPPPFALGSGRRFGLAPGTVALHPGCKASWPWKKWHGFAELAAELPHVVIVGADEDRRTDGTYFRRAFQWPAHARNFTGALSLPDTAALLAECAALVSNDSGLMHLGVAMGIPVLGVFGITSPAREAVPAPNMLPVTKGLPCEPACRRQPWGRRDCARHLQCLRTLDAADVLARLRDFLATDETTGLTRRRGERGEPVPVSSAPSAPPREAAVESSESPSPAPAAPMSSDLSLAYYGYVSDESGYGHTARAYVHALHGAGVRVRVVDLARRRHGPSDPLVASLMERSPSADVHLFHGIPAQWARLAFPLRNALGMTVWETDAMPAQWRNALNHVQDVWLPCAFNVETFARSLETPIFRLPHPVFPPRANGDTPDGGTFLGVEEDEFVFYAIFEWQDRKGPHETLDAYLSAFSAADRTVLVVKTGPGAADAARRAVDESRARHRSDARVEIRAERWAEPGIEALHRRGDCYVSLHRGEGWGYPLFEAAGRGKPVVATAYSGPLDYLDPDAHGLVRWTHAPVRQPYHFYNPRMRWADPDVAHAAELMRGTFDHRAERTTAAAQAGARIRERFSIASVGAAARARLEEVLARASAPRIRARTGSAASIESTGSTGITRSTESTETTGSVDSAKSVRSAPSTPSTEWLEGPVPLDWYDADYFRTGRKSNWDRGYTWPVFGGLFRDTAEYLAGLFPDARRCVDAGCATGLLVRALRERGIDAWGVDGSPWAHEHADPAARPYLVRADVAEWTPDRGYDVATAFNLLAHLTEAQAHAFLMRLRPHVGTALLATIPTVAPGTEMPPSRDRSHVTRQPRAWWMDLFRRAGWHQDGLHRVAERIAREPALPRRMGWDVFVLAPGCPGTDR